MIISVITIAALNPSSASGWKNTNCMNEAEDKLLKCIEDNAYFVHDILHSKENDTFKPFFEKDKIVVETLASDRVQFCIENPLA